MGRKGEWIICNNSKCTAYPVGSGLKSWRYISHGPDSCKFCDTPFRLPVRKGLAGAQPGEGSWWKKDGKGRSRPAGDPVSSAKNEKPPAPAAVSDDAFEALFRARFPDFFAQRTDLEQELFPKKPKSPKELLNEGFAAVEKAQSQEAHLEKICNQMEEKYDRLCTELMDYQGKLREHQRLLGNAKDEVSKASEELARRRAADDADNAAQAPPTAVPSTPVVSVSGVRSLAQSCNPLRDVTEILAHLPVVSKLSADEAASIGSAMSDLFRNKLLDEFCSQISTAAAPAFPSPSPPPPPPPVDGAVCTGAPQSAAVGAGDAAMVGQFKRGREDFDGEDPFSSQMSIQEETGAGLESGAPSGSSDLRARAEAAAQAAMQARVAKAGDTSYS